MLLKKLYYRYEMGTDFTREVREHYVNLRCIPVTNSIQQVYGSRLQIDQADFIIKKRDGQGNQLVSCRLQAPHTRFSMVSEGVVFVDVNAMERERFNPHYSHFTRLTRPDRKLGSFFETCCKPLWKKTDSDWEKVQRMMHALFQSFSYESGVTDVSTTAADAFSLGKGVCQDYAQILIALCRLAGIQARYVSGFMVGEGATHAWIEVFENGYWYGFDPTHDRRVTDCYIKVAHGRDFDDCPMERGVFRGLTSQTGWVKVTVKEHAL